MWMVYAADAVWPGDTRFPQAAAITSPGCTGAVQPAFVKTENSITVLGRKVQRSENIGNIRPARTASGLPAKAQLRAFVNDSRYEDAIAIDGVLSGAPVVTTDEVLAELMTFFSENPRQRSRAARTVRSLLFDPNVRVIPQSRESFLAGSYQSLST